jgi:hypothetical protein
MVMFGLGLVLALTGVLVPVDRLPDRSAWVELHYTATYQNIFGVRTTVIGSEWVHIEEARYERLKDRGESWCPESHDFDGNVDWTSCVASIEPMQPPGTDWVRYHYAASYVADADQHTTLAFGTEWMPPDDPRLVAVRAGGSPWCPRYHGYSGRLVDNSCRGGMEPIIPPGAATAAPVFGTPTLP